MSVTLHVVTPCLNAAATIDRTILSVVSQAGDFRLAYHVQDGGSTDGTLEKLADWQRRLETGVIPRACRRIRFSYVSDADAGMYDTLVRGIGRLNAAANTFVTWINAGDILMPGALATAAEVAGQFQPAEVSWFGGAGAELRGALPVAADIHPIPSLALRAGLCDGLHWADLRQPGVFFRRWLWTAAASDRNIAGMRLAGDWNLWRLFAQKASLVQVRWPLGASAPPPDGKTGHQSALRLAEIDACVSPEARRAGLEALGRKDPLPWRYLKLADGGLGCSVQEEDGLAAARSRYAQVFGRAPDWPARPARPPRRAASGKRPGPPPAPPRPLEACLLRHPGLMACDADWQFPAVTEQHAFVQMRAWLAEAGLSGDSVTYVAFPWATLIDKLQVSAPDAEDHLERFHDFCAALPAGGVRLTVCQHILMRKYLHLFREAGIDEIFWSHATRKDIAAPAGAGPRLHAFPLYPVQVTEALPEAGPGFDPAMCASPGSGSPDSRSTGEAPAPRRHLFSFVGAKANEWYLSRVRDWILESLAGHPRGVVAGRDAWHYQRVVYDHQIQRRAAGADGLQDDSAAGQFRALLKDSVFALCPSGSGPNSIRLWEAIGAGAIPVILADGWAPPGDARLWEAASVVCAETPEAVAALPQRLEEIAADPARLAAMRQAMRQIWMLYGPPGFTLDVEKRIRELAELQPAAVATGPAAGGAIPAGAAPAEQMLFWAGRLLLDPDAAAPPPAALDTARATLPPDHPAVLHLDRVLARAGSVCCPQAATPTPAVKPSRPLRICLFGRHSHRTPLSYAPLQRVLGDRAVFVTDPAEADVLLTGFVTDLRENAAMLAGLARTGRLPRVVVLSEEPLWDTIWSGDFTRRRRRTVCDGVEIPFAMLNHETTDIFRFARIPYFLLTSDDFAPRYTTLIARQAARPVRDLLAHWQGASLHAAFFAEVREDPRYAAVFPDRDIRGLSVFRTEVARTVTAALPPGRVLCAGRGWGAAPRRQDLPDWHLDKLATLHDRVLVASAYENTHHPQYVSEKIFDAFAVGGIPTYVASPGHRIRALVPDTAMLNAHGLTSGEASAQIARCAPDATLAEAWLETAGGLAALFRRADLFAAERRRVIEACLQEIARELDTPSQPGAAVPDETTRDRPVADSAAQ